MYDYMIMDPGSDIIILGNRGVRVHKRERVHGGVEGG